MIPNDVFLFLFCFVLYFVAVRTRQFRVVIFQDYVRCLSILFLRFTPYVFLIAIVVLFSSFSVSVYPSITYFIMCKQSNQCHVSPDERVLEPG